MSLILPSLILFAAFVLFRRCYLGQGNYLEFFGAFAMVIVWIIYMIGFIVGVTTW